MKMKSIVPVFMTISAFATSAHAVDCGYTEFWDNCSEASSVSAISTFLPTILTVNASDNYSARHHKVIIAAQEDAHAFIASEGRIYGVNLVQAIEVLRKDLPHLVQANDMQIARAIIGQ